MRTFHWDIFLKFYIEILPYLSVTFSYVFFSLLFGFGIGIGITVMKFSGKRILSALASIYISVMRCVPSVVLLFLIYYGLPMMMKGEFGISMDHIGTIVYVIITFSLFLGASTSEIMRAGYLTVGKGQREAGYMVGLSGWQTFYRIIFPQAVRACIPNIGNIIIYMIKEGALAYTIGLQDVLGRGYQLNSLKGNAYSAETYVALALIYWPCTIILEKVFAYIEKKVSLTGMIAGHKTEVSMEEI